MITHKTKKYDLAICYRIYPKVSKVPPIFAKDKLKLAELCLLSFKEALCNLRYKLFVLLDSCPESYYSLFKKYFNEEDLELIKLQNAGNPVSFGKQIDVLLNQNFSEIIYFAEDDYLYLPMAFPVMHNAIEMGKDFHFLSPYNHPDYNKLLLHKYSKDITLVSNTKWQSVSTTTMTFMTTKSTLRETLDVFLTYTKKNNDNSIWLSLTKKRILNPHIYFYYLLKDWTLFKALSKVWIYSPFKTLLGKKYNLWVPQETLATHLESDFLAEGVEWEYWFSFYRKKINI